MQLAADDVRLSLLRRAEEALDTNGDAASGVGVVAASVVTDELQGSQLLCSPAAAFYGCYGTRRQQVRTPKKQRLLLLQRVAGPCSETERSCSVRKSDGFWI
jgi:hypothetical protein